MTETKSPSPMDQTQYNQVYLKNLDSEPFQCIYNNQSYGVIMPGAVRVFAQFMANLFLKHLIDQILNRKDKAGALIARQDLRAELASQIVVQVVASIQEQPKTAAQVLEEKVASMNKPSDLELLMAKEYPTVTPQATTQTQPAAPFAPPAPVDLGDVLGSVRSEQATLHPEAAAPIPPPPPPAPEPPTAPPQNFSPTPSNIAQPVQPVPTPQPEPPQFVPSEAPVLPDPTQQAINATLGPVAASPNRDALVDFARNTLMINPDDPKTKEAWATMSDEQLAKELNYEAI